MLHDGQMSTDTIPSETESPAAQADERAARWEPQRRMTLDAARRRSGMVKVLRWGFIILAVLIVGVVVAYLLISARPTPTPPVDPATQSQTQTGADTGTEPGDGGPDATQSNDLVIENPVFEGVDKNGHPYKVTADRAIRRTNDDGTASDVTDLVNPQVETYPGNPDNSIVTAQKGVYDSKSKSLDLSDSVKLVTPDGYVYETEHVHYEIDENRIVGTLPVTGKGTQGSIDADGFEILDGGNRVIFHGKVKTHILNDK